MYISIKSFLIFNIKNFSEWERKRGERGCVKKEAEERKVERVVC